jgi:fibronectin-binding autotransporter adhesin
MAVTNDFIGGTAGSPNDWNTSTNWSQGHVPLSTEDVTIQTANAVLSSGSDGVAKSISVASGRTLSVTSSKTLTVGTGTSSLDGTLSIDTATVTLNGPTSWSGGTNTISIFSAATLNINSSFSITGDGSMAGAFSPLIHVGSTGSVTTSNTGTATIQPALDNDGSVSVGSGTLSLSGGDNGTTTGSYSIASGATLLLQSGGLDSPSITGAGTIAVGGCCGTLTVSSGDTFTPSTVDLRGDGAVLTANEDVSIPTFETTGAGNRTTRNGSGTLTVTKAFTLGAPITFTGGRTTVADTVTSVSLGGAAVTVDSSVAAATLTLDAPTTWSGGAGTVSLFGGTATLNINSSFSITGDGSISGAFSPLIHVGATGSITTSNPGTASIAPVLDNDGSLSVGSGTLSLGGGDSGTTTGSYSIASGATLLLQSGGLDSPSITGAGTMAVGGCCGTLTVSSGDTFTPGALDLRGDGAVITVNEDVSVPTFKTTGAGNHTTRGGTGTLTVTSAFTINAPITFTGGTTTVADTVPSVNLGAATVTVDASASPSSTLTLDTPTSWNGTNAINLFGGTASLNINSAFDITGDGTITAAFGPLMHVGSTGSITTSNSGTVAIQPALHNDGTVTVGSGTTQMPAGVTQAAGATSVAAGATLAGDVTLNGGTLGGGGTVNGSVANTAGTVAPGSSPGTLTVSGNYSQGSAGTLSEDITGTAPGTQFDQLLVGGSATLDGTLAIHSSSFTPSGLDTFKIISGASSRSGTFASLTGATVNGVRYSAQYDTDGVTLTVSGSPPPPPPSNSVPPSIPSTGHPGDLVTCDPGTWTGSPTFRFSWTLDGNAITGQAASTYTLQPGDLGHQVRCVVVGHNAGGDSAPVQSNALTVSAVSAPKNTATPSISGRLTQGQTLTCNPGSWSGSPTFAFGWLRDGQPISGATKATYVTVVADAGHQLSCRVTAANAGGSASATSATVAIVPKLVRTKVFRTPPGRVCLAHGKKLKLRVLIPRGVIISSLAANLGGNVLKLVRGPGGFSATFSLPTGAERLLVLTLRTRDGQMLTIKVKYRGCHSRRRHRR